MKHIKYFRGVKLVLTSPVKHGRLTPKYRLNVSVDSHDVEFKSVYAAKQFIKSIVY